MPDPKEDVDKEDIDNESVEEEEEETAESMKEKLSPQKVHKDRKPGTQTEVVRVRLPRRGQLLGEVEQLLGDRRMLIRCTDGHTRLCRIPGKIRKRIWINEGNIALVEPWSVQENERGDIVWRYTNQQADWLEKRGYLKGLEQL